MPFLWLQSLPSWCDVMHGLVEGGVKRGHERRDKGCQFDLKRTVCPCKLSSRVDSNDLLVNQTLDSISQGNALVRFVAKGTMKSTISGEVIPFRDRIRKRKRSWLPQ